MGTQGYGVSGVLYLNYLFGTFTFFDFVTYCSLTHRQPEYEMNFEEENIDPYAILGVPFGASIDVCKATFKSLAKIYHPDVFVGDKAFAAKRMAELNAAYEFLDNPKRKKSFDDLGEKPEQKEQSQEYNPDEDSDEFSQGSKLLKKHWEFACNFHPELIKIHAELYKLNADSAFLLMAIIVEDKSYKDAKIIAKNLESAFLKSKFSKDKLFQKLAKHAILSGESEFARDLNKALKILGVSSKFEIISKLSDDYPEFTYSAFDFLDERRFIPENNKAKEARRQENAVSPRTIGDEENRVFKAFVIVVALLFLLTAAMYG